MEFRGPVVALRGIMGSCCVSLSLNQSVERLPSVAFYLPHVDDKRARHCRSNRPRRENEDPGPRWERETTAHEY